MRDCQLSFLWEERIQNLAAIANRSSCFSLTISVRRVTRNFCSGTIDFSCFAVSGCASGSSFAAAAIFRSSSTEAHYDGWL